MVKCNVHPPTMFSTPNNSQNLIDSGSGRTTIAVAHRLSTIRNANEILSMVDGIVVERGTHQQLIDSNGIYQSQWQIQTGQLD
mgnify:CR=1 FL=1